MGFLGFGSGIRCPCFISFVCSPVSAAIFSISVISSFTSMGLLLEVLLVDYLALYFFHFEVYLHIFLFHLLKRDSLILWGELV